MDYFHAYSRQQRPLTHTKETVLFRCLLAGRKGHPKRTIIRILCLGYHSSSPSPCPDWVNDSGQLSDASPRLECTWDSFTGSRMSKMGEQLYDQVCRREPLFVLALQRKFISHAGCLPVCRLCVIRCVSVLSLSLGNFRAPPFAVSVPWPALVGIQGYGLPPNGDLLSLGFTFAFHRGQALDVSALYV